ncbi:phosphoribosylformylglycinamidine synthase subunit PurL [Leucobacter sp. UCMA 4100]|uniref:phosphoribosylformylglycinamidine synthase subunit PurL n=1 Tax=Leucobacter sp. UCMA 4100 TaxID=2810534 RepID=UPI0022EA3CE4|nr:phosphoribosylformylglycinamidine synthase subunit PurL [Leucobacter sp. UCMA 4100]MDA3147754.1 phosphoribosylformylglycinamidine synthase subunit PurL [Leucobacter sp. UCMA 4100]
MNISPSQQPDTVANAQATPELEQPYAALGLADDEYQQIRDILGRRPTSGELSMYSVMWSEHCSYKSSKVHLRQFGQKTNEKMQENLIVGIGENAGVVDIGEGWAITFKGESHNSPSFIEPFQGAATGVGGIIRDIISMGARPVAIMDQLRVGDIDHPDTARVLRGAVEGASFYAGALGLPNIGGETVFNKVYQGNPLVNVLGVGALRHEDLHLAKASGKGTKVVIFGARTGADGIGGASVLASADFSEDGPTDRPAVQLGDPFLENLIIDCCLELFAEGLVEGIQDLGAAGISCATSELAANGDGGMYIELDSVPVRDEAMTAEEILMSESQERMMAVVTPANLERFLEIADKWKVEAAVIGEVTDNGRLIINWRGEEIVNVDPSTVANDGPVYERPMQEPSWLAELQADSASKLARPTTGAELRDQFVSVVTSPNQASKEWLTNQLDSYAQGNTALTFPDSAGMIRVDEESGLGIAVSADANSRYCQLDAYRGTQLALAEAFRNVAVTGAVPMAVTNCLNFGSPENPEVMWQFAKAVEGLADGCLELEIPVTGGNVSMYNSTGQTPIYPTPVVGVVGVIDNVARRIPSGWQDEGENLYLLGVTREELDGSAWAETLHDHLGGVPPLLDLTAEQNLAGLLQAATMGGIISGATDLSDGGLGQAVAEASLRFGVGARVWLDEIISRDGVDAATALFSESQARALVSVPREEDVKFRGLCEGRGVPVLRVGVTDGTGDAAQIEIQDQFTISVAELGAAWRETLPSRFAVTPAE